MPLYWRPSPLKGAEFTITLTLTKRLHFYCHCLLVHGIYNRCLAEKFTAAFLFPQIPESFADCLGGLLSVVGQNLSLKLELQGGNSVAEVHANRAINWTTPDKTCDIAMGDLQSEEERDIVMELKLPTMPNPQQDLVIKASLSYFNVITSALDTVTFDLNIDRKGEWIFTKAEYYIHIVLFLRRCSGPSKGDCGCAEKQNYCNYCSEESRTTCATK